MSTKNPSNTHAHEAAEPGRWAAGVTARVGIVATTVTIAALGPGLALAEATRLSGNHNEVMVTTRRR